jgi:hypothetical protein
LVSIDPKQVIFRNRTTVMYSRLATRSSPFSYGCVHGMRGVAHLFQTIDGRQAGPWLQIMLPVALFLGGANGEMLPINECPGRNSPGGLSTTSIVGSDLR